MRPVFGFPGGKSRGAKHIKRILDLDSYEFPLYVEPFVGGFSFGLKYLPNHLDTKVWINDIDPDLYCLWYAILHYSDELCEGVKRKKVSPELFYKLQKRILSKRPFKNRDIVQRAMDKLIVHKLSYSCMGEMSSLYGGLKQIGCQKFDDRWNPDSICSQIQLVSNFLFGAKLTKLSFEKLVPKIPDNALVYLDPPYVDSGSKCYKHSFTPEQHRDLAEFLKTAKFKWFLSYDTHYMILDLYRWADIYDLEFDYHMSSVKGKKLRVGKELLITGGLK